MIARLEEKIQRNKETLESLKKKKENLERNIEEIQTKILKQEAQLTLLKLSKKKAQ